MPTATKLMWDMAKRAKDLANMKMPDLRRAADYEGLDLGDGSRGAMIEAVLTTEFEDEAKQIKVETSQ